MLLQTILHRLHSICSSSHGRICIVTLIVTLADTIQIPQGLLSGVDDTPLTSVHVRPLAKVLHASRIQVDPLTTADWELLQVHAEEFERGAILKQVSVVTSGQQLKFRIQNDFIHVMVQEIRTALDDSPWPAYSDDGEIETPQAVMLVNDTEMVVTPKPRPPSKSVYGWSVPLQVVPCTDDKNAAALEFSDRLLSKRLDVLPASMVVHPDTWDSTFGDWARVCEDGNKDNFLLARIETSQDIPTEQAGTFSLVEYNKNHVRFGSVTKFLFTGYFCDGGLLFPIDTPENLHRILYKLSFIV